ncbi:sulfatase family protein [Portibacter lacus]|uniref:Sulfatase N-terminal domain-containing protein n=1 Tax=Portibacter lacus TaxID=1099794 RepID=A0AA37SQR9_9BACT|nr:sulfatase [Portibacter lacus]GLR17859.1 hypothetical protein GCM10007940_24740 [Portibacter lacus]
MKNMHLRNVSLLCLFIIGLLSCKTLENSKKSIESPNILWITIEDTSPQFIGCYGNKDASTPVIDQLAKEGVRFTNAFSTGTVCSPSRSAIITGVKTYKMGTGNHRSNYPVPEYIKGFPYYLQEAGYYTTNNSKTDYNVANMKAFTKEAWNESSNKAGWWNRETGQAFFAVFNYADSHQSRTMTESYEWYQKNVVAYLDESEMIGDNDFDMPPFYKDTPAMRKQVARVYNSIKLTDNKIGDLLDRLEKDGLRDNTIIVFYGDHGEGIPRGKTNGINLGYRVPFIISFPEKYKHLSPWGTGGVVTDELIEFTDLAPTMISLSGGRIPEHLEGRILMGKKRAPKADHLVLSSDRADNGIDMVRSVTNGRYVYSRNYMPFLPQSKYIRYVEIGEITQEMRKDLAENKLNPLQKSLFEERPPEYLFDIEKDLWETNNLANDPGHQKLLKQMRANLKKEILASRDVMFLPEYEIGILSKTTTPYEYRLDPKQYPLAEIYDAAALAGFRGANIAAKQAALLKDSNPIVRYWGILGLYAQNIDLKEKYASAISEVIRDSYPPVAITASAMAYRFLNNSEAEGILKSYIESENFELALMTINYLLYCDQKEPFIELVKAVRLKGSSPYKVKASCTDFLGILGIVENNTKFKQ